MKASRPAATRQSARPAQHGQRARPTQLAPLTYYVVNEYDTIFTPGIPEPSVRSDVFTGVCPADIRTTTQLIDAVNTYPPLAFHFTRLANDRLSEIEQELKDDPTLGATARRRLAFLAAALRHDPDDGWQHWVTHEGDPGLASFRQHIQDWLDEDVDLYESEYFDSLWNGQSVGLEFFSSLESSICEALGVELVYGEHPGSSYYAAELKVDIAQANAAAESLGLDFRFQAEGDIAPATQALDALETNAGVTA